MSDVISDERQKSANFAISFEEEVFEPLARLKPGSHCPSKEDYDALYAESLRDDGEFWARQADELHFFKRDATKRANVDLLQYNFHISRGPIFVRFMEEVTTNLAYNCLERNIEKGMGDKVAFYWEGNHPSDSKALTYQELLDKVIECSLVLRRHGVRRGDRVAIYLPMVLELPVVLLACARIGAVHSVVLFYCAFCVQHLHNSTSTKPVPCQLFAGFSAESLASRIDDAKSDVLITADAFCRGTKVIDTKKIVDDAIALCNTDSKRHSVKRCIVVRHIGRVTLPDRQVLPQVSFNPPLDVYYDEECAAVRGESAPPCEQMGAEEPLFMLYTSGSTGKPKGVVHTQAGYMVYTYATTKYVFDVRNDDIYWCTADIGWITGHSYLVYGPLLNGLSNVLFEGVPTYPNPDRFWRVVEKYAVTKFYTAPTAIRALMAFKTEFVANCNRSSLRVLGTVGEPINPAAWIWYNDVVGEKQCAIVDTYWQTETVCGVVLFGRGGHLLTPLPGAITTKPGSATLPFFGIEPALMTSDCKEIQGPAGDANDSACPRLCMKRGWPGMMRTVYNDHARFESTYFSAYDGYYFTGDGARRDDDSYYWITGRVDDQMNVSGHLLSTAEIESALVSHPMVSEAAVVAAPDAVKGHVPYAFVTLKVGQLWSSTLEKDLRETVRRKIGAIAVPHSVQLAPGLPKTRSGKITRRILRVIAEGDPRADLGDTSTVADPQVLEALWAGRPAA